MWLLVLVCLRSILVNTQYWKMKPVASFMLSPLSAISQQTTDKLFIITIRCYKMFLFILPSNHLTYYYIDLKSSFNIMICFSVLFEALFLFLFLSLIQWPSISRPLFIFWICYKRLSIRNATSYFSEIWVDKCECLLYNAQFHSAIIPIINFRETTISLILFNFEQCCCNVDLWNWSENRNVEFMLM